MLRNIIANKYSKYFMLFSMILLLLLKGFHVKLLPDSGDDRYFLHVFNQEAVLPYLYHRYIGWSGRIVPDFLAVTTIGYPFFWKIMIPSALLLMALSLSRIITNRITLFYSFIALFLLFAMPRQLNSEATSWITGAYNYLIPFSCAIYTLSLVMSQKVGKIEIAAALLCILIFSYQEQAGLFFILMTVAALVFLKETRNTINYFFLSFSLMNFIILLAAPGNYKRLVEEAWNWFPDYRYYTVLQKMSFGFDRFYQLLILNTNFIFIFFLVMLVFLYFVQGIRTIAGAVSAGVILLFIFCLIFESLSSYEGIIMNGFLTRQPLSAERWGGISIYLSYFAVMAVVSSAILLLMSSVKDKRTLGMLLILFGIAFLEIIGVGLSPTIYVSSDRIDYVSEVIFVMMDLFLLHYIIMDTKQGWMEKWKRKRLKENSARI